MAAIRPLNEQINLVNLIQEEAELCRSQIRDIWADINYGVDRRERERVGSSYPNPELEEDCREEFKALHRARVDAEQRLADHEAILGPEIARLHQIGNSLVLIAPVNQPQLQAAPAPSVSVPGTSAAPQTQPAPRWDKRWACSICLSQGVQTTWDRRLQVQRHASRHHKNQVVQAVHHGYQRRN